MQTHWETWKKLYSQGQTQWEILCLSILKILIAFQSHYKLGVMKKRQKVRKRCVCLFGEAETASDVSNNGSFWIVCQ